ncbi:MAG: hypothetical protein HY820_10645 [Acidobacteria bacterium]|nr:hypothetical protein [Acidobacteriota bacterium]
MTFFLLVALALPTLAEERPMPSPEIQAILGSAQSAPPELAADILLRLADSRFLPSKEHRLEVIEQAFELAAGGRFAYAESAAVNAAAHTDSSPGIRAMAVLDEGLSTLGLRCRAVRLALPLDKSKALSLFRRVQIGPFPALTCSDPLQPNLDEYYQTLHQVADTAFSAKDRAEERHLEMIASAAASAVIPQQLTPLASLLAVFPMPPQRRAAMASGYAAAIDQMNADARSFEGRYDFAYSVIPLARVLQTGQSTPLPLARAVRAYLSRHLQGERCAELALPRRAASAKEATGKTFNDALLRALKIEGVEPLDFDALKPKSIGGAAKFADFWADGRALEMMRRGKELRFGTKEQQEEYNRRERRKDGMAHFLPEELRRTPAWEAGVREFLRDLDKWRSNHEEAETDFFHQLCLMYGGLLVIVPSGPLRESVLQDYVSALKTSPMQQESPPEWLLHVKRLLRTTDATPEWLAIARSEMRRNGGLTMGLYAELARLGVYR